MTALRVCFVRSVKGGEKSGHVAEQKCTTPAQLSNGDVSRREPGHGVNDGSRTKWYRVWARSELEVGRAASHLFVECPNDEADFGLVYHCVLRLAP